MNSSSVAREASEEWDYRHVESDFGGTMAASIPCQLRFTGTVEQDTEAFHDALGDRNWGSVDHNPDGTRQSDISPYYDGEVASTDHWNRVRVLVFRGDCVRLYPHDDYVPDVDELETLIEALEVGFGAPLKHDPIDGGSDG